MSLDIKALSITAMFNNIKSFFQSQENNSRWRDLSKGAEGIFFMRMIANLLSVLSSRIMTNRREVFHDTANLLSSQIGLAVNNGYSVYRGRNHRRRVRLVLDSNINKTIPALSVVGFYDTDYAIITLEELNPSKNNTEENKTIEFMATVGALKEISWQANTSELKKFVRHEQGISEDYQLFRNGEIVPTSKIAKDKIHDKYYLYTNPYKSVTIEYLNNMKGAEYTYDNNTTYTLRYVELADMPLNEFTADMFTIGTLESSVVVSSFKPFEDIESIKQNSPVYREMQNLIRSKEDWKDAYKDALPVVKEITYRALTPSYTQLSCIKSDYTLMESVYNSRMTEIEDIEEKSIRETLEPARYFGRPFPDNEDPKREVTTLNILLGLTSVYKYEEDIKAEVRDILDKMYTDKFNQIVDIYDVEQALKSLPYVKYARVSVSTPERENFTTYRKGDTVTETLDIGNNETIEKVYRCKDVLGLSSFVEPTWNVPGTSKDIETGYITEDNELIWQCYKKLENMENVTPWNYNSYYGVGDFVSTETYPNHVFKCISLIAKSGSQTPDVVNVDLKDFVEDGNILLVCIPYNSAYKERESKTNYKLRDKINISGLSFEVVGFLGTTSGATSIKVRSESQELYAIPSEARTEIAPGSLYLADEDFRTYVKQGDLIQVSAKLAKDTLYEEMVDDGLIPSAIISAKVKEYEDEDSSDDEGGDEGETTPVVTSNTTINIDLSNSQLTAYGLSSRVAPSVVGLNVDSEIDDFQLHLVCIPYDETLPVRQNSKRYYLLDKFNIVGTTAVSFEVMRLQSAGLSAEATPHILDKHVGDTVEDYQLVETCIAYDSSYPMWEAFTEYKVGTCLNIPDYSNMSVQVTGITEAGNDTSAYTANGGSINTETEVTPPPNTSTEQTPSGDSTGDDEPEEQNANWKKLEEVKGKMEYIQSWITSETNDTLRTPADVLEFYRTLGDGSRVSAEERALIRKYYREYKPEDEEQIYIHMDQFDSTRDKAIDELVAAGQLPEKPLIDVNCIKYYNSEGDLIYIDRYGTAVKAPDGTLIFRENYEPLSTEYAIRREDPLGNPIKILSIHKENDEYLVEETYTKTFVTTVTNVTYNTYPNVYINRYLTRIDISTPLGYYMEGSTVNFAYNTVLDGKILWEEVSDLENVEYGWNVFPRIEFNLSLRS